MISSHLQGMAYTVLLLSASYVNKVKLYKNGDINAFQWKHVKITIKKESDMALSKELLDILVCPKCKGEIHLNEKGDGLICEACQLEYRIEDDIPIMLIDEAIPLSNKGKKEG